MSNWIAKHWAGWEVAIVAVPVLCAVFSLGAWVGDEFGWPFG